MPRPSVTLHPADERTRPYVETLLARNGLPTADLGDAPVDVYVCYAGGRHGIRTAVGATRLGGERVGVGALEQHGAHALLRSLVVEASVRDAGYGSAICERLEARARDAGVEGLFVLTTTATDFFAERGYEPVERGAAPRAIRQTSEFATLCPDGADCLRRSL